MRLMVHPALLEGKTTDRAHVLWETLQGFQDVANGLRVNTSSNSIAGWDDVVASSLGTKMPFWELWTRIHRDRASMLAHMNMFWDLAGANTNTQDVGVFGPIVLHMG